MGILVTWDGYIGWPPQLCQCVSQHVCVCVCDCVIGAQSVAVGNRRLGVLRSLELCTGSDVYVRCFGVRGDGGFPIQIGGGFLYNTYLDVSCMYPACILHVFRCVPFRYIKIH